MTNLFTQVPITDALRVIEERLTGDQSLESRTNIPVPLLVELVELCLRSSYFQFQDSFYDQTDGAAMGSPLSPIVANLYLEHLEEEVIQSAPLQPKLWRRYVDDTFVIWSHGQDELHHFHQHLNSQYPSIKFTMEEEKDHKIAFLDVLVTRNGDRLATLVYRKPTHTIRYIPFHSNHHPKTITGVMRGMRDRAHRVCDPSSRPNELQHLNEVFQANGFPAYLVKKTLTASPKQPHTGDLRPTKPRGTLYTPYAVDSVRGLKEYALPSTSAMFHHS